MEERCPQYTHFMRNVSEKASGSQKMADKYKPERKGFAVVRTQCGA